MAANLECKLSVESSKTQVLATHFPVAGFDGPMH